MNSFNSFQDIYQPFEETDYTRSASSWAILSLAVALTFVLSLGGYSKYKELELRCKRMLMINAELTNRNIELQLKRKPSDEDGSSLASTNTQSEPAITIELED